jgi:hypothetical protein
MTEKGLDNVALATLLGEPKRVRPNIHLWLGAKGAPGSRYRNKLAQVLGITAEALGASASPSQALVVLPRAKANGKVPVAPAPTEESFARITITRDDGAVVIRLTLTKEPM